MTFYSGEHSRVRDCIEYYVDKTIALLEKENNNQEQEGEQT